MVPRLIPLPGLLMSLTVAGVKSLKFPSDKKSIKVTDGQSLYILVMKNGSKL